MHIPFLYAAIRVYTRCREERPEFPYPMADLTEFWKSAVTIVICITTKPIVTAVVWPIAKSHVKDQNDVVKRDVRLQKLCDNVWSLLYFLIISTYGYHVLQNSPWMPSVMGGSGSLDLFFQNTPWREPIPGAVTYALIQIGYHAGDTLSHLIMHEKRNDFYEMLLHH